MTPETLKFLRDLVARQQISAETPNIVEVAKMIAGVRNELDTALLEAESEALTTG